MIKNFYLPVSNAAIQNGDAEDTMNQIYTGLHYICFDHRTNKLESLLVSKLLLCSRRVQLAYYIPERCDFRAMLRIFNVCRFVERHCKDSQVRSMCQHVAELVLDFMNLTRQ